MDEDNFDFNQEKENETNNVDSVNCPSEENLQTMVNNYDDKSLQFEKWCRLKEMEYRLKAKLIKDHKEEIKRQRQLIRDQEEEKREEQRKLVRKWEKQKAKEIQTKKL